MTSPKPSIKTRFMIISDTHSYAFHNPKYAAAPFQHPTPRCDVLLHCGDLTMNGGLDELRGVVEMLEKCDAEVKVLIAGNHDRTLDGAHWRKYCGADIPYDSDGVSVDSDDDDVNDHAKALEIMTSAAAKGAGIIYLEEGIHTITLSNGAKFTLYASPYQPEFCGWAFPYERDEDRFNPVEYVNSLEGVREVEGSVKVPDFPGVDVMITHGPPRGILDGVFEGRLTAHVGCDALMTAVGRARPLLYAFGHIHEGYGARVVEWKGDVGMVGEEAVQRVGEVLENQYPDALVVEKEGGGELVFGRQTLIVNAAVMNVHYWPRNAPWVVDLELEKA